MRSTIDFDGNRMFAARRSTRTALWCRALAPAWIALALCNAGCAQRIYKADRMPTEFLAAGVENVQTIDLSRLAAAQTTSSKQIGPGDLLEVTIESGYSEHTDVVTVRVADDGLGMVPLVGRLHLAGMEPERAERLIAAAAVDRGLYRDPTVTVDVTRQRTNRVTVIGAVENPSVYELPSGSSSLLAAIVAAGGLSENAGSNVEIRRPNAVHGARPPGDRVTMAGYEPHPAPVQPASMHVDLCKAARGEEPASHVLGDGDIVMVEKRDPQPFDVMGLVGRPGRFDMPPNKDMYVLDALAIAGGTSTPWADKAHLVRQIAGRKDPIVVEISIKRAMEEGTGNFRLMPGDVLSVEKTPTTVVTGTLRAIAPYSFAAVVPFIK